jgi:hypothetical protein
LVDDEGSVSFCQKSVTNTAKKFADGSLVDLSSQLMNKNIPTRVGDLEDIEGKAEGERVDGGGCGEDERGKGRRLMTAIK